MPQHTFGLIAGNGKLPRIIAFELQAQGYKPKILCFYAANQDNYTFFQKQGFETTKISLENLTYILDFVKKQKINKIVCCGGVKFTGIQYLKLFKIIKFLNIKIIVYILQSLFSRQKGDNFLLSLVDKIFASIGCEIVSVQTIMPDILCNHKDEINPAYAKQYKNDIEYGSQILKQLSKFDIGQSIVVCGGRILGVEGAEGTEELIKRCGKYYKSLNSKMKKKPILIKMTKDNQNRKLDMPSIGIKTIRVARDNNFGGIAIENNGVIMMDKKEIKQLLKNDKKFIKIFPQS